MNAPEEGLKPEFSEKVLGIVLSEAEKRRQRMRSVAIAWALGALVVIFFLVTIVRMGGNVFNRPF